MSSSYHHAGIGMGHEGLYNIFKGVYHFDTEVWDIPDEDCHVEVNQKILDFSKTGGNSKDDLKIVYYAGHGRLMNRLL
jgi:hypothetical protein